MAVPETSKEILDVDLLAFETGDRTARDAVVAGVMKSLRNGFVYTNSDLSEDLLDTAYGMLEQFFGLPGEVKACSSAPGTHGQTGYTGLLVETAAISDVPDWKEMLNWGDEIPEGHPLQRKYPHRYPRRVLPENDVSGITEVLVEFHRRVLDLQRRFLRIIAVGIGCGESFFDGMLVNGTTLTRAIHYPAMENAPGEDHVWAAEHADINLVTALPRATAPGLQVKVGDAEDPEWVAAAPPERSVIINTGILLEHITNGRVPSGIHRVVASPGYSDDRYSVVQFAHPTPWTIMAPVGTCVTKDNPLQFASIEAGDLLDTVVYDINLVEDARRVD